MVPLDKGSVCCILIFPEAIYSIYSKYLGVSYLCKSSIYVAFLVEKTATTKQTNKTPFYFLRIFNLVMKCKILSVIFCSKILQTPMEITFITPFMFKALYLLS